MNRHRGISLGRFLVAAFCAWLLLPAARAVETTTRLVYPRYFAPSDTQREFDWIVLRTALEKTVASHGRYEAGPWHEPMSIPRMLQELSLPEGHINVIARATDRELEKKFQPIRIPIDRGLMGMRLLLVRKSDLHRYASIRSLDDLKRFSAGQGKGWVDSEVLAAAGFSVVETPRPGSLLGMLEAGRFDFFPRALDEAPREYDANRKTHPGIAIEPTLCCAIPCLATSSCGAMPRATSWRSASAPAWS